MDGGYLVQITLPTVIFRFFCNFTYVLIMPRRYACDFDIILRLFLTLFLQFELKSFFSDILTMKVNGQ